MIDRQRPFWKWMPGLTLLVVTTSALLFWYCGIPATSNCPDCQGVYQSILRDRRNDYNWNKTHVLVNKSDGFRFIASDVITMRSKLQWFTRFKHWSEFDSFLAQKDGQPLAYSGAENVGLRLITANERVEILKRGITVLTFTLPGFSFDHRRAMVFVSAERQYSLKEAPVFKGSLIYLKKARSKWIIDHPWDLPEFDLIS